MTPSAVANSEPARLAGIVCLGLLFRLLYLDQEAFWLDESITTWLAATPLLDLFTGRVQDSGNPQGFWVLGHVWGMMAGQSDVALRMLSVVAGCAGIVATYFLGKMLGGPQLGLWAAALLAINPGHIHLSQEFRAYTSVYFTSCIVLGAALRYRETGSWRALALYCSAALGGMYLHYYAALIVIAVNVWMLFPLRIDRAFLHWCAAQLTIAVLYLPAVPLLVENAAHRTDVVEDGTTSLPQLAVTPVTVLFGRTLVWKSDGPFIIAVALVLTAVFWAAALRYMRRRQLPAHWPLLLCAIAVPLALVTILMTLFDLHSWDDRKVVTILAPVCLVLAHCLLASPRHVRFVLGGLLLTTSLVAVGRYYHDYHRDDWRSIAREIAGEIAPGDAIVVVPEYELYSLGRYLHQLGDIPDWREVTFGFSKPRGQIFRYPRQGRWKPEPVGDALADVRRVWFISNSMLTQEDPGTIGDTLNFEFAPPRYCEAAPRELAVCLHEVRPRPAAATADSGKQPAG